MSGDLQVSVNSDIIRGIVEAKMQAAILTTLKQDATKFIDK